MEGKAMTEGKVLGRASRSAGDIAVDGLLRGVAAGLAMMALLVISGLLAQLGPRLVLSRFDPTGGNSALSGALAHLATAGIYGLLFALLTAPVAARLGARLVLAGVVYGLALWLVSLGLMGSEVGAPLRALPPAGWLLAHVIFGGILGWLLAVRR
jgi:hypothetical protein